MATETSTDTYAASGGILAGLALLARTAVPDVSAVVAALLTVVVVVGGLVFVAGLRERLGGFWGTVAAGGWIMTGVLALVRFALNLVAADPLGALIAPLLSGLSLVLLAMVWACTLPTTAAVAFGARGDLARPFVLLSGVAAVASIVGVATLASGEGFLSYAGGYRTLMFVLIGGWLIVGGASLRRRASR
jgi:hypothetical protein